MALTYVATAADTAGNTSPNYYKTVTFTSCAVGDLLVVGGITANAATDGTTREVATTSGSTSAWTQTSTSPVNGGDVDSHAGWATVSGAGDVTVRVNVRSVASSDPLFVGGWRIPAADWDSGGTPAFTTVSGADADGQVSVVVAATSTVLYWGGDWTAADPGTTNTPTGATNHTSFYDSSNYAVATRSWTAQAAGTRNYGPSGLSSKDYGIIVCQVPEAASGTNATATPTVVSATAAVDVSGWATRDSLIVMGGASKSGRWT